MAQCGRVVVRFLAPVTDDDLYAKSLFAKKTRGGGAVGAGVGGGSDGLSSGNEDASVGGGIGGVGGTGDDDHPNSRASIQRRYPLSKDRLAWARHRMARLVRVRMLQALQSSPAAAGRPLTAGEQVWCYGCLWVGLGASGWVLRGGVYVTHAVWGWSDGETAAWVSGGDDADAAVHLLLY